VDKQAWTETVAVQENGVFRLARKTEGYSAGQFIGGKVAVSEKNLQRINSLSLMDKMRVNTKKSNPKKAVRQRNRQTTGEALLRLAKLGQKLQVNAQPDLSARIDDILYGDE
jgi:hypothetical protein